MIIVRLVTMYGGDHIVKIPTGQAAVCLCQDAVVLLHPYFNAPFYGQLIRKLFLHKVYVLSICGDVHFKIQVMGIGKIHIKMIRKANFFYPALNGGHGLHNIRHFSVAGMGGMQVIVIHLIHVKGLLLSACLQHSWYDYNTDRIFIPDFDHKTHKPQQYGFFPLWGQNSLIAKTSAGFSPCGCFVFYLATMFTSLP